MKWPMLLKSKLLRVLVSEAMAIVSAVGSEQAIEQASQKWTGSGKARNGRYRLAPGKARRASGEPGRSPGLDPPNVQRPSHRRCDSAGRRRGRKEPRHASGCFGLGTAPPTGNACCSADEWIDRPNPGRHVGSLRLASVCPGLISVARTGLS